ncbi:spoIIIJ-associated protein [Lachnospiraceae bacterium PM6-15]|uniref:RNA-binding cell elongation regulator Jag/EloR n=1 Tax=Ohessyouella blattaphilus TaxID=2949333 RepID=UPI003E2C9B3F
MDYITLSAKTVDDAITEALVELGITSDQLDYEVVEKGSAGFLGIGMKQAVIRARKKRPEPKPEPKKEVKQEIKQEDKEEPKQEKSEPAVVETEPAKEVEVIEILEPTKEVTAKFVKDVLASMNMDDVEVTYTVDSDNILCIDMAGKNMGILIGKRGQTLDSLQYLANRVANKAQEGYVRVKLDTEDYRRRRKETLENLARNIASKVKKTRKPFSLEPMNPYERRIIHSYLQGDDRVATHSEGNEPYRKVVITYVR